MELLIKKEVDFKNWKILDLFLLKEIRKFVHREHKGCAKFNEEIGTDWSFQWKLGAIHQDNVDWFAF